LHLITGERIEVSDAIFGKISNCFNKCISRNSLINSTSIWTDVINHSNKDFLYR